MRILALSDAPISFLYSSAVRARFAGIDLLIGCGDLSYAYLEYVYTALDVPLFYVRGNHDKPLEFGPAGERSHPHGGIDLHRRVLRYRRLLLAGVEGSPRYRSGPYQYSQAEMWENVLRLVPGLVLNRLRYGRALDIFVTHAPPSGIHEGDDYPHRGIQAFRWLVRLFRPALHLHGHVHLYSPAQPREDCLGATRIINAYGFREVTLDLP